MRTPSGKSSPLLEEAFAAFPYEFIDENEKRTRLTSTTKSKATKAFNEMARLYGDERALAMVKTQPAVLTLKSENFAPSLDVWAEAYGSREAAQAMMVRNPGLLGIPPVLAAENTDATMAMSYVIAITRPTLPKFVLLTSFLLRVFYH